MSDANGEPILKIGRKGRLKIAVGDGAPVEIDVIGVQSAWLEIDRMFKDGSGKVPPEKWNQLNQEIWNFARGILQVEDMSLTEALEFMRIVTEKAVELRGFFEIRSSK